MENQLKQLGCGDCDSKKLSFIGFQENDGKTEIALLCVDCGKMGYFQLDGTLKESESTKPQPNYAG